MYKAIRYDNDGFYIEDIIVENKDNLPINCTLTGWHPDVQYYKPKYDKVRDRWVEGATKEEIEEIKKGSGEQSPYVTIEQLKAENAELKQTVAATIEQAEQDRKAMQLLVAQLLEGEA